MNPNDEVLAYGRENNVGDQYNDIILTTLRDTYDSSASLTDLYGKAWLSGLRDGNTLTLPTLHLPFTRLKQLDSRITFTRASNATYFDAAGVMQTAAEGVARFDHNPSTGESLGLLIEEARTNLLTYSEQFGHAGWTKAASSITSNAITAPDGTLTADKLVEDTTTGFHVAERTVILTLGVTYALSVYIKNAGRNLARVYGKTSGNWAVLPNGVFDLTTGEVTSSTGVSPATCTPVGNGWFRCCIYGTSANGTSAGLGVNTILSGTVSSFTGDGTSGLYIWGAQLEAGTFPTSYIKTEATALTRAADIASMTGTNFSSWYNQSEGTFVSEYTPLSSVNGQIYSVSDSLNNRLAFRTATVALFVNTGGVTQAFIDFGVNGATGVVNKTASGYKVNSIQAAFNGTLGTEDTSSILPVVTQLELGQITAVSHLNGHISRLTYYPKRLSNATLQVLSA